MNNIFNLANNDDNDKILYYKILLIINHIFYILLGSFIILI